MWFAWLYAICWQASWFLLVWQAGTGGPWALALLVLLPLLLIVSRLGRASWRPLLAALLGYLLVDGLALGLSGALSYQTLLPLPLPAPLWILALWCWLAGGMQLLLPDWLRRPWALALLGLCAPLAYAGGLAFDAVGSQWPPALSLILVAGAYALVLPLLGRLLQPGAAPLKQHTSREFVRA